MNSQIIDAIKNKKILELRYHGFNRVVEPHAYGRDKDGDEILRCFQIAGGSESGESTGWKLLKVRDIYFIVMLMDKDFTTRSGYKKNDSKMTIIFEQI